MEGSSSSLLRRVYLTLYNWVVFFGWLQVLYLAVRTLKESGHEGVYDAVERPLLLAQSAALLEILHGLVGIVRSPITATLPQIGSRLYVTWGILWSFPETRNHMLVSSLVISWSITEIIRYSFFGLKEALGSAPSWLMWLRYSTFLILYPTGIASEVGLIYVALPYILVSTLVILRNMSISFFFEILLENKFLLNKLLSLQKTEKYCIRMPNKWNFSFDYFYFALLVLGIYVPGGPHMYSYMLGQRKRALSKSKRE